MELKDTNLFMVRDSLEDIPTHVLPPGFHFRWYQVGDRQLWTDIQLFDGEGTGNRTAAGASPPAVAHSLLLPIALTLVFQELIREFPDENPQDLNGVSGCGAASPLGYRNHDPEYLQ